MVRPEEALQVVSIEPDAQILEKLRSICLRLPGAVETTTFSDHPTFRAGKKTFAVFEHHPEKHATRIVSVKATMAGQALLVKDPRYARCPFGGRHGWVLLDVDRKIDWKQLARLLVESYRLVAPRRLLAELDARDGGGFSEGPREHSKPRTPPRPRTRRASR